MALINIESDIKDMQGRLKKSSLNMESTLKGAMTSANRIAIKVARRNAQTLFKSHNNPRFSDAYRNPPILGFYTSGGKRKRVIQTTKAKKGDLATYVYAKSLHANSLEHGATINAKEGGYLNFKVGGRWVKVRSVTIPATPFLNNSVSGVYTDGRGQKAMTEYIERRLQKEIGK